MLHEKRFSAFEIKSFDDRLFDILTNLISWIISFFIGLLSNNVQNI